jgi:hypothetical protein
MKSISLLILLILPLSSFAQSVSCKPHGGGDYTKLEIYKPDEPMSVPWFMAKLDNKYNQRKIFTVIATSRGDKLLFISQEGKSEFNLDFGHYHGPDVYHSAKLTLNQGAGNEENATLMCEQVGDLGISNLCLAENPEKILFSAAQNRDADQLEAMLSCGLNANIKNKNGCTPLLLAADENCGQKLGTQLPYNPMTKALPVVDILTNNGALLESKDPWNAERALHKFARSDDLDVVSLLLDLEAEVDPQDKSGFTPLMRAVETNDFYLVQRLVESNPDLKLKNKSGDTALELAQKRGYSKLIPLLQAPASVIEIKGDANGTCSPTSVKIKANEVSKFTLKASPNKMFMLESPGLALNLMADDGGVATKNIRPTKKGTFDFTCGVHGAAVQTTGQIIIE